MTSRTGVSKLSGHYDVVIVGGAVIGSSTAYFLSEHTDFDGSVLVVEPDPTYQLCSTTLSEASIRHQFSNPVNIALSQYGTAFIRDFHNLVEVEGEAPELGFRETGYMFLATASGIETLRRNVDLQRSLGADIALLAPNEAADRFPYLYVDDLAGASLGEAGEGTFDAHSLLMGFRQRARHNGVQYCADRVVGLRLEQDRVCEVQLESGRTVGCSDVVNAAGPRARAIAQLAGLDIPVEPRRRSVFVFGCRTPIEVTMPLTIDVSGVHIRAEPPFFLAGGPARPDIEVDPDDFAVRHDEFESHIWPAIAHRIPQFDQVGVKRAWAGHYAYNTLDQNAIVGRASAVENFLFANGFSGHGLQQAAGVGRGVAELITDGEFRTLDLTELGHDRILRNEPFVESAII